MVSMSYLVNVWGHLFSIKIFLNQVCDFESALLASLIDVPYTVRLLGDGDLQPDLCSIG